MSIQKVKNSFNPRSYKRSDPIFQADLKIGKLSIHAPTRGATLSSEDSVDYPRSFNPRSYKRSDGGSTFCRVLPSSFNPRSYKRSDHFSSFLCAKISLSIHAPTRGATAKMHNIPYASLQ